MEWLEIKNTPAPDFDDFAAFQARCLEALAVPAEFLEGSITYGGALAAMYRADALRRATEAVGRRALYPRAELQHVALAREALERRPVPRARALVLRGCVALVRRDAT